MYHIEDAICREAQDRLPNWRWRIVMQYWAQIGRRIPDMLKKDELLTRAITFHRKFRQYKGRQSLSKHFHEDRDLLAAHWLHQNTLPGSIRWRVEAGLSTGEGLGAVHKGLKLTKQITKAALQAYMQVYYDVSQYGGDKKLMRMNAINLACHGSGGMADYDQTWKDLAYQWGLDEFIRIVLLHESLSTEQLDWFHAQVDSALHLRGHHLIRTQNFNEESLSILRLGKEFRVIPQGGLDDAEQKAKREFVDKMLDAVNVSLMHAPPVSAVQDADKQKSYQAFAYQASQR